MNVRPVNPALKLRPEAFDCVHPAAVRRGVLALVMADGDVIEAEHIKAAVAAKFVGRHGRAGQDMRLHKGFHRRAVAALDTTLVPTSPPRSSKPTTATLLPL